MLYRQMRFFESSIVDSFYLVHKEQRFSTPAFACTMDDSNVGYQLVSFISFIAEVYEDEFLLKAGNQKKRNSFF